MTGLFCSITSGYSHQRDAVICQSRIVNHVYIRQATDFRQNRETYSLSGSLGKSVFWAKLSMTLNGSYQSMTNALQSWNHEIRICSCDYSRHYTTDHTDVVVCNRLRPREFLCKLMFDL